MFEAYEDYWRRYFDFAGRTSRAGYWKVILLNIIISLILGFWGDNGRWIAVIYSIVTIIPGISIIFRRLHDTRRSGWNVLWLLVPIAGWIVLIVFLASKSKYKI